jgi:L-serine dehydratase
MDRRRFITFAGISAAGLELLARANISFARGIPGNVFPIAPERGYQRVPAGAIAVPLRDLFKVGPGPSSSHTIAPLRISTDFRSALEDRPDLVKSAVTIEAHLYGSLSATGRGHRTDRAIIAGLLGEKPETCNTALMDELGDTGRIHTMTVAGRSFQIGASTVVWDKVQHSFPFTNTMIMRLVGENSAALFEREYYSTGGGFFQWKGQPDSGRGAPVHAFANMEDFKRLIAGSKQTAEDIVLDNEKAILNVGESEVMAHLDLVLATMLEGVELGLAEEGVLPGPFEFHRKAGQIYQRSLKLAGGERFMGRLSACALAVSERNAAGRLAVTAPTLGSAGTMPAVAFIMKNDLKLSQDAMRRGLLMAGLVGILCKANASVAGAEVGCQGEIGVASAMAAAMITHATGHPLEVTEIAATMALEHHLGMSCDPVGGFVLIPCIERNAFGAIKAYNAYLIATNEIASQHWEDLDRVIAAMLETGRALPQPFKEMGTAGLGVSMVNC